MLTAALASEIDAAALVAARQCLLAAAVAGAATIAGRACSLALWGYTSANFRRLAAAALTFPFLCGTPPLLLLSRDIIQSLLDWTHMTDFGAARLGAVAVLTSIAYSPLSAALHLISLPPRTGETVRYLFTITRDQRAIWGLAVEPALRIVTVSIFAVLFSWSALESQLYEFVVRPSEGTGTELISGYLFRKFSTYALVDPKLALQLSLQLGACIFVITLVILTALIVPTYRLYRPRTEFSGSSRGSATFWVLTALSLGVVLIGLILPIAGSVYALRHFAEEQVSVMTFDWTGLGMALSVSAASAIIAFGGVAAWTVFAWRVPTRAFGVALLIYLVPPLTIAIAVRSALSSIGLWPAGGMQFAIVAGIFLVPLCGYFYTLSVGLTPKRELSWLKANEISLLRSVQLLISRHLPEIWMSFLVCLAVMWNYNSITRVFSSWYTNAALALELSVAGRDADLALAATTLATSIFLGLLGSCAFFSVLVRNARD